MGSPLQKTTLKRQIQKMPKEQGGFRGKNVKWNVESLLGFDTDMASHLVRWHRSGIVDLVAVGGLQE